MRKRWFMVPVFLILLVVDLIFRFYPSDFDLRLLTSPPVLICLMIYYFLNSQSKPREERIMVFIALTSLMIGQMLLISGQNISTAVIALTLFTIAMVSYSFIFYRNSDGNIKRAIPFILISSLITIGVLYFLYDSLQRYYLPLLIYVITLIYTLQGAYMRYNQVNTESFYLVLLGTLFFIFSQMIDGLNMFGHIGTARLGIIMLFYAMSQFMIIHGILVEHKQLAK
ncbi:lysoplasmalogenase family protein [Robertkochia solimangrovi]|uniref:lysoplasmalogenase family protein n=1 Tax=Robertkochia solimangrovi TaxID=2213046 RepID=UPI00117C27E9|nr:lysoplasmalogenase family protein [Robertkochia solimangrovi]TRZ45158.1 hypothetical protein DMZ48_05250 [Robertkochia solimangrovi]